MSAIRAVTMPKWGLAMTEGTVVAWQVAEGEPVAAGAELVDIETAKITNALEAPVAGVLRRQVARPGTMRPVGALLGVIADAAVPAADIDAFVADFERRYVPPAEDAAEAGGGAETVTVEGRGLRVLRQGAGAPVLLIHGFGGDLGSWLFNQPALAERHAVVAFDLPGHGESGKAIADGSVAALAGTAARLLDALGLDRVHVVGQSLGGAVALELALARPDRVQSVTAICPVGLGPEIDAGYLRRFLAAERARDLKAALQTLFADPGAVGRDMVETALRIKRLDGVRAAQEAILAGFLSGDLQAVDLRPRLRELAMPVQAIWGAADRIIPPAHGAALDAQVLADAGHMVHMEQPSAVNRLIAEFIAQT